MLKLNVCTDPAGMAYFRQQLSLPEGDFLYVAADASGLLAGVSFTVAGNAALLQGIRFLAPFEADLADGLLRASLDYAQRERDCSRYTISPADDPEGALAVLGYTIGLDSSIEGFFQSTLCY